MMITFTRQQAIDAAATASGERDTIQANLLDLDGGFGKQLLAGAQLTGISKRRWDDASAVLAGLWEIFNAYSAVVDRAAQLAAGRLAQRELAEISELLTGPSVEIVRIGGARRDITDSGRDKVTLATARARMRDAFSVISEVTTGAEQRWSDMAGRLDNAASALNGLDPMGDQALAAETAAVTAELSRLRAALNADPFGADLSAADGLRQRCGALAKRAADLAALRTGAAGQIAAIRALADSGRAAQAAAASAYQRAAAKIASVPPVPATAGQRLNDLAPRLAELDGLLAAGRWDRLRSELDLLRTELTAVADQFHQSEQTLVSLLSQRDELRGLLDAYKAKAARLGAAEDPGLGRQYDEVRALLYTAPCDLTAASAAVNSYQQAVNGWRIGAR
jgi:chromosome segregation ATPase